VVLERVIKLVLVVCLFFLLVIVFVVHQPLQWLKDGLMALIDLILKEPDNTGD